MTDQLKTTKLTAAKICHEIANHLSVLKFLQEDLKSSYNCEADEIINIVDLLTATMDFFRNIYSTTGSISNISKIITDIYRLKKITIENNGCFYDFESTNEENIICGMLYVVMKSCKSADTVSINFEKNLWIIKIKNKNRKFSDAIFNAINNDEVDEDIFNVFVLYIKKFALESGYSILTDEDATDGFLRVKIWKK